MYMGRLRCQWPPHALQPPKLNSRASTRPGSAAAPCNSPCRPLQVVLLGPFSPDTPTNSWLPELSGDVEALW